MNQQTKPSVIYRKEREILVAKNNVSVWINDHFYFWLSGDKITDSKAVEIIKSKPNLIRNCIFKN